MEEVFSKGLAVLERGCVRECIWKWLKPREEMSIRRSGV